MIVFGHKPEKNHIIYRKGAYGIMCKDNLVALVMTPLGYFLLGGGHEVGESDEECLSREVREEIGYSVTIGDFFEEVQEFVHVEEWQKTYCKDMRIYSITLESIVKGKIEDDHELVWKPLGFAVSNMYLKGQAYVLEKYAKKCMKI